MWPLWVNLSALLIKFINIYFIRLGSEYIYLGTESSIKWKILNDFTFACSSNNSITSSRNSLTLNYWHSMLNWWLLLSLARSWISSIMENRNSKLMSKFFRYYNIWFFSFVCFNSFKRECLMIQIDPWMQLRGVFKSCTIDASWRTSSILAWTDFW